MHVYVPLCVYVCVPEVSLGCHSSEVTCFFFLRQHLSWVLGGSPFKLGWARDLSVSTSPVLRWPIQHHTQLFTKNLEVKLNSSFSNGKNCLDWAISQAQAFLIKKEKEKVGARVQSVSDQQTKWFLNVGVLQQPMLQQGSGSESQVGETWGCWALAYMVVHKPSKNVARDRVRQSKLRTKWSKARMTCQSHYIAGNSIY